MHKQFRDCLPNQSFINRNKTCNRLYSTVNSQSLHFRVSDLFLFRITSLFASLSHYLRVTFSSHISVSLFLHFLHFCTRHFLRCSLNLFQFRYSSACILIEFLISWRVTCFLIDSDLNSCISLSDEERSSVI